MSNLADAASRSVSAPPVALYSDASFAVQIATFATLQDALGAASQGQAIDIFDPNAIGALGVIDVLIEDLTIRADDPFFATFWLKGSANNFNLLGDTNSEVIGTLDADVVTGGDGDNILFVRRGDDIVFGGKGDDFLISSNGTDVLNGGAGNDSLLGGLDADTLDGGSDTTGDSAYYSGSNVGVTIDLSAGTAFGGHAEGDVLIGIEHLFGSRWGDDLRGDAQNNVLTGYVGSDTLDGRDGDDNLVGGLDADHLISGLGADTMNGGVGAGDHADYSGSNAAVIIGVNSGAVNSGGHAEGDVITTNTENLTGSAFADQITGNTLNNVLIGGFGNDTINASSGNDTVQGGEGDDLLLGSRGADLIDGGAGADTASYANSDALVIVDLAAGTAIGSGHSFGDTLISIEGAIGSQFHDSLFGDGGNNSLRGLNGSDDLFGAAGDDTLVGDGGKDTLTGGTGNDVLNGGAEIDTFVFDTANFGADTILRFGAGFGAGCELMDFRGSGVSFSDLTIWSAAGDTVVSVTSDPANQITLVGIASGIDASDFLF